MRPEVKNLSYLDLNHSKAFMHRRFSNLRKLQVSYHCCQGTTQACRMNLEKVPAYHKPPCTASVVGERPEIEYPQGKKQILYGKTSLRVRKSILKDALHTLYSAVRN